MSFKLLFLVSTSLFLVSTSTASCIDVSVHISTRSPFKSQRFSKVYMSFLSLSSFVQQIISKVQNLSLFIHSFIQAHLYSASSSPLVLIGSPDTALILCQSFTQKHHRQLRVKTFPRSLFGGQSGQIEPAALRTKGVESTNEPQRPNPLGLFLARNM